MVVDVVMDSMYLENLDEFVNDEEKIVTYKWLSLTLGVHTNVAKQMLYHFVTKQRNSYKCDDGLNVTYMVSGVVVDEDQQLEKHKMVLVREENLEAMKSKLKDVISVHIYSVQKSKLKDLSALYTANYDAVKEKLLSINSFSGIECPAAKVRSSAEHLRYQHQNGNQESSEPVKSQKIAKPTEDNRAIKREPENEDKEVKPKIKMAGKSNHIASMFARQATKSEGKDSVREAKKPSSAGSRKQGGLDAFFSKGPPPAKHKTPDSPVKSDCGKDSPATSESSKYLQTESEEVESPLTESLISSSVKTESRHSTTLGSQTDSMELTSSPPLTEKAKKQSKIKPKKAPQKRGKSKNSDDEKPVPKRKRIMQLSDSDSSSDEETEDENESPYPSSSVLETARIESDEEIPDTPQPEPKHQQFSKNGRLKKRKLISKTFMDDDGFFVTKKEYEFVSDSEEEAVHSSEEKVSASKSTSEINIPSKKPVSPSKSVNGSPKKQPPAKRKHSKDTTKTKQSSIMSFFGKK